MQQDDALQCIVRLVNENKDMRDKIDSMHQHIKRQRRDHDSFLWAKERELCEVVQYLNDAEEKYREKQLQLQTTEVQLDHLADRYQEVQERFRNVSLLPVNTCVYDNTLSKRGKICGVIWNSQKGNVSYELVDAHHKKIGVRSQEDIRVIPPGKKEKMIIISGEKAGYQGVLIGIDGDDGLVKLACNGNMLTMPLNACALLCE